MDCRLCLNLSALSVCFKNKWVEFGGGMALGIGFMMKPYLAVALAFIFFSAWRRRSFHGIGGVITAGILGFFGSLMAPGIDLDAYWSFLVKAPKLLVRGHYQTSL